MTETIIPQPCIRKRLGDLNTKGYYLLVALSFIYRSETATWMLKLAISLTALAVVLPVQEWTESPFRLKCIRNGKISFLIAALVFALVWIWSSGPLISRSPQR
jgi:hypothetical protein